MSAPSIPLGALCNLLMCSDPWPVSDTGDGDGRDELVAFADAVAREAGFAGWIDAHHKTGTAYAATLRQQAVGVDEAWSYCPECGSDELRHQEGDHKQCASCGQEYFADVDYTDVVRLHLSRRAALAQHGQPEHAQIESGDVDSMRQFIAHATREGLTTVRVEGRFTSAMTRAAYNAWMAAQHGQQGEGAVAWMDKLGNVYPLGAHSLTGKLSWQDAHKRNWRPLFTRPAARARVPVGIEAAIEHIQQKAEAYAEEHCGVEWDTGATTYHHGQAGEDYHHSLLELVDELQAIAAAPSAESGEVGA